MQPCSSRPYQIKLESLFCGVEEKCSPLLIQGQKGWRNLFQLPCWFNNVHVKQRQLQKVSQNASFYKTFTELCYKSHRNFPHLFKFNFFQKLQFCKANIEWLFFSPFYLSLHSCNLYLVHVCLCCSPIQRVEAMHTAVLAVTLSQVFLSFYSLPLGWSLNNLPLVSSVCLPLLYPPTPLTLSALTLLFLFLPTLFRSYAVALLRPAHKVAVGDIVKVTNGQHLPADMVIVSSRSDSSVYVCVWAHSCEHTHAFVYMLMYVYVNVCLLIVCCVLNYFLRMQFMMHFHYQSIVY